MDIAATVAVLGLGQEAADDRGIGAFALGLAVEWAGVLLEEVDRLPVVPAGPRAFPDQRQSGAEGGFVLLQLVVRVLVHGSSLKQKRGPLSSLAVATHAA